MITTPNQQEDNALGHILSRRLTLNGEFAAYVVILVLALFSRFHMLDDRVMSHDESLHTRFAYNLYNEGNFQHTPLMHGPVLFHATAFSFYLFGDGDFSGRIYTALLGVLMVMFPLLWRRWLGRWGALLASLMILISPLLLYYSRYIRHDIPSIFFAMIMAHCILMYMRGPQRTPPPRLLALHLRRGDDLESRFQRDGLHLHRDLRQLLAALFPGQASAATLRIARQVHIQCADARNLARRHDDLGHVYRGGYHPGGNHIRARHTLARICPICSDRAGSTGWRCRF